MARARAKASGAVEKKLVGVADVVITAAERSKGRSSRQVEVMTSTSDSRASKEGQLMKKFGFLVGAISLVAVSGSGCASNTGKRARRCARTSTRHRH